MKPFVSKKLNLQFPSSIPKHWLGGSAFKTHLLNSFTLIFPTGEKYFIRSINKFRKEIQHPKLKEEMREFIKQETQHFIEHEKFFLNLNDQGYDIDVFVKLLDTVVTKILEPFFSDKMNLAITSGLEHFTALLAEIGLKYDFLSEADPIMKELFEWHAAEEIEHRSVAFDILQTIDDDYILRAQGLILAYAFLFGFSATATAYLITKDKKITEPQIWKDMLDTFFFKESVAPKTLKIALRYLRPGFHPKLNGEVDQLLEKILSGAQEGVAA